MNEPKQGRGRIQLLLIAAVFLGPLALAAWLYFAGEDLAPAGRTNHGALLQPIVRLADELPASPLHEHNDGHWVLLYANANRCDEACEFALYTLRQSRLMLGKEMDRLLRVFLHGDTAPDTVLLAEEHAGLITLQDSDLKDLLDNKKPANLEKSLESLEKIVRIPYPHEVPGSIVGQHTVQKLEGAPHVFLRLADAQTADGVPR